MFIELNRTDLLLGYRRVQEARYHMIGKWRSDLLRAYSQRWNRYFQAFQQYEQRRDRYAQRILPRILLGIAALLVAAFWITWPAVLLGCIFVPPAIAAAMLALAYWQIFPGKPTPPEQPLEQNKRSGYTSPFKTKLFPNVIPDWWQGLAADHIPYHEEAERMAAQTGKWGLIGEFLFIRELDRFVGSDTLILHSVMPKRGDDLDVVVIGPKGIWYFEIKYVNADFEWCDGTWTIWQKERGVRLPQPSQMLEYPDAQWERMRKETFAILDAGSQIIADLKGGIVFAHPDAKHRIQGPAPFRYGTLPEWIKTYVEAPVLRGMTSEAILQFTETLLRKHQQLNPGMDLFSMHYYRSDVISNAEREIRKWIQTSQPA